MTLPGLVRANNLNDVVDRERAWDNLGSSLATGDIAIPAPSLNLNFAANKSLVDDISGNNLITFTRASTGTFVGSNGLIQSAASGVPRFDHNPTTGESLGLLVEEARTNLVTYSTDLTNAVWTIANLTRSKETLAGPAGTVPYDKLTLGTFTASQGATYSLISPLTDGTIYSVSIYVKQGTCRYVYLGFQRSSSSLVGAYFDLLTGAGINGGLVSAADTSVTPVGNGWLRIQMKVANAGAGPNGNFFFLPMTTGTPTVDGSGNRLYNGNGETLYVYAPQVEAGSFPTSYIPTVASTVTRAADVASITGANFSSWYNQSAGTFSILTSTVKAVYGTGILATYTNSSQEDVLYAGGPNNLEYYANGFGVVAQATAGLGSKTATAISYNASQIALTSQGASPATAPGSLSRTANNLEIGSRKTDYWLNGTIARLAYWPTRLYDQALQYITQPSITAINLYAFNYAINGKDVLALNAVRNASTRNFIFIKGLLSAAQPRLTTAAASTSSALTLATNALPKLSPTSSGNYFFASGITLSGVTTRINGTNALSIATSPFSGSTATAPLLFRELRPQANWRFTEPMPSGTIASPEFAIPFETNDFVLFMKAGPN
jgi:hypothetical protein